MLGISLAGTSTSPYVALSSVEGASNHNGFFGGSAGVGGNTTRSILDLALEPFRHHASGPSSPPNFNSNSFSVGLHDVVDRNKDVRKVEMEIGETIVGAVLGHGGRSLIEIQQLSGASVQISKKGIYASGTRNRIVSISGTQNAIATAQTLIGQKIKDEEVKRTRQNQLFMLH